MKSILLILLVVVCGSLEEKLPSDWKSCKGFKGTELNDCLKISIESVLRKLTDGVPKLKVPPIEPLVITSATIEAGTQVVHVVQNYKNFLVYGISTAILPKLEAIHTSEEFSLDFEVFIPENKVVSDYDVNGQLYIFPVVGNGTCQVVLKNLTAKIKFTTEKFQKKGIDYLRVNSCKVDLLPGKVFYNFENLFNGNEKLGKVINQLLNDNWKEVFDDVKFGYNQLFEAVIADYINRVFYKVPYEHLL